MKFIGKYIRHASAWAVGLFIAFLADWAGVAVTADQEATLVSGLTVLGMLLIGVVYSFTEKWLKRFKWVDPEAWAERVWSKKAADHSEHDIRAGHV